MAGTLEIRRKIRSIKSTRQITRAMELVAASKMKRAIANTTAIRPYASHALALLTSLYGKMQREEELPSALKFHKNLVILVTSDRGLCGGYNTLLFKNLIESEKNERNKHPDAKFDYIAVGKKGQDFCVHSGRNVVAAYHGLTNHPHFEEMLPIAKLAMSEFEVKTYDRVILCYQFFVSPLVQVPIFMQLLPFSREVFEEIAKKAGFQIDASFDVAKEYLFEPSAEFILGNLLPRLTEMQIYQAVLESTASEHSSRMVAMKNATTNASDLIDSLTLTYNQIRQAKITQEIAEISAGRIALGF